MQMQAVLVVAYPESQESAESGHMMLQDADACDDSELLFARHTLIDSVHPEDVRRHVWHSRGRWRQALERAISMRGQAPPPPGW
eukprot:457125-Pyramimonas_sp.AAC.1